MEKANEKFLCFPGSLVKGFKARLLMSPGCRGCSESNGCMSVCTLGHRRMPRLTLSNAGMWLGRIGVTNIM